MDHELTYVCIGCGYDTFNASRYCTACAVIAPTVTPTPALEEETRYDVYSARVGRETVLVACDRSFADAQRIKDESPTTHYILGRSKTIALGATLALALIASPVGAQDTYPPETYTRGCVESGVSGEGFPVMYCPEDGATYYIDLDGTDGALGTAGDGRWVQLP